ncbi:XRE family transcriptional regulator [Geothermobacter hydrogeniphilus]|uniref:XRE family transcriptional regulator n=2 Tax=Geothermobacter hydrogeniphilus TaxID=1969733 RepID=A0A2K2H745_9BACT|nr:XRE family transcriptional regulator [Geothermobacter hydrogeniphilus]
MKKLPPEQVKEEKERLYNDIRAGRLTIGQATVRMRKIVGMTQKDYAEKILKIYPRVLMEIEKDRGNPTVETLKKVGRPFGLQVGFVVPPEKNWAR